MENCVGRSRQQEKELFEWATRMAEGQIDFVILFSGLEPEAHNADVKALLRIAIAVEYSGWRDRASADFIISSPLMSTAYERLASDYSK